LKKIRIGCGSGGCSYERLEPAIELVEKGNIDYLIFECLAERTIAEAQRKKIDDPETGYNPMLEERMRIFLPLMKKHGFKIVSNMGAANTPAAIRKILSIAREEGITGLKIASVIGDDITKMLPMYADMPLWDSTQPLSTLEHITSANVYLGADAITEALDQGADIVITGRIADPSLFVGPILHEFHWDYSERDKIGQALLVGHMMECCAQLTGGYYADPGYKDVPDLHRLGHPIAQIDEEANVLFTKPEGSGGMVCVDICKEQLLYEIGDPTYYITPDAIADFGHVCFRQAGKDVVIASGATSHPATDTYKVNISYLDGFIGVGEISFGGTNARNRAVLAADTIQKRWQIIGITPQEYRIDYIGHNSLYGDTISEHIHQGSFSEIRLRIAVRTKTRSDASRLIREVQCMYINGPAGSAGIECTVKPVLAVENILVPKTDVNYHICWEEI